MRIQVGEIKMEAAPQIIPMVKNKAVKYLLPCLREYGEIFINKLNKIHKVAVGLGDIVVSNRNIKYEKHIFILVNTVTLYKFFIDFLAWIREQSMYEDDYVFGDIQTSCYHMIIIKFPEKYYDAFPLFKKGKYSEMFKSKEDLNRLFEKHEITKHILNKDHNYKFIFAKKLNKLYGSNISGTDIDETMELDLPPREAGEVFNHYLKTNKNV